jgi:hypothetical protein
MKAMLPALVLTITASGCAIDAGSPVVHPNELRQQANAVLERGGNVEPKTYVARCMEARLKYIKADPSQVRFKATGANDVFGALQMSAVAGHVPPAVISTTVLSALVEVGFELGDTPPAGNRPHFSVHTALVGFTPLQESSQTNMDADLLYLMGGNKRSVSVGDVSATTLLWRFDRQSNSWVSVMTHTTRLPFWMDKRSGTMSVGLKTGVSAGHGWEAIQIRSVSDASILSAKVSTLSAVSKALKFECT